MAWIELPGIAGVFVRTEHISAIMPHDEGTEVYMVGTDDPFISSASVLGVFELIDKAEREQGGSRGSQKELRSRRS